ncbi:PKD domain-containing protein [Segetibacter sp. 3557_3]|uniref:PKD domain-containing protein n=1 Tax=Segetibacter sp. 3557_3 TaxID=2547429 RepID=UPI00140556F9|nr:PKD domain-containing protein [Segetibacter sp. 3557_3]
MFSSIRVICVLLSFLACQQVFSQDFSNKGTDFWVGYSNHVAMYSTLNGAVNPSGGSQNMVLYFTSDQTANVRVEIPATGWSANYVVTPNTVTESATIPKTGTNDARLATEGLSNRGIHITSDKPVVAYAHVYDGSVSGATLLFPTNTLGQDYTVLGFTQSSNSNLSYPFAFVIATEDSTVVEVTPSAATLTHAAGVPFTQTLKKGEILNLLGQISGQSGVDLTGTRIRSISTGTTGCKRIAVFCGSGKLNIRCNVNGNGSADNTIQQCFPANAWGRKYITIPTRDMANNFFRVMVSDPSTSIKLNGAPLTGLTNGRYYEFQSAATNIIEADKPVMVAQFITTANQCTNTALGSSGDPEMIYLSPVEQTINKITLNSTSYAVINPNNHYINVVMKSAGVNSFMLDGVNSASSFAPLPNDPSYSYAQFKTKAGIHNLVADSGFNAIAYGFGNAESYGYNAGTNVLDLYQFVSLQNEFATVNFPATCRNTPFFFSITLPYLASSLSWRFNNNPNLTPNADIDNAAPAPDSSFVRDGRTLYVYKLKGAFRFSTAGTYGIKVLANNPTADGCNGKQEISYEIVVYDPPQANFSTIFTGCISDTVRFSENGNGFGRAFTKWRWDFGDQTTDSVKNPLKKYNQDGSFPVHLRAITDIGCVADTTKSININNQPIARFDNPASACVGSNVTFTDSSAIIAGNLVKWTWNFGDGSSIVNTTGAPVNHPFTTAGNFTVSLVVESSTGCKSLAYSRIVNINPAPNVDFNLPAVCLPLGVARFQNLSTINDGSANSLSFQWNFGDNTIDTARNPVHTYASAGPFMVGLKAYSVAGCSTELQRQVNNIYPAPVAGFDVAREICFRDTAIFSNKSNGSGSAITKWYWNFGDGSVDSTQNPKHRYAAPGSYTIRLYVVTDKGCVSDTIPGVILVNALPVADFTVLNPTCEKQVVVLNNQSSSAAGNLTQWNWNFGDGTLSNIANGTPVNHTYNQSGTYNVRLSVLSDKGCKSDTTAKNLAIYKQPVADFILPKVCLADAAAQFIDSSYATDGSTSTMTYLWNFGDGNATNANPNSSTDKNAAHKYTATGNYTVLLTTTSANGCIGTSSKIFTVNGDKPIADFNFITGQTSCSNLPVQLQNTSTVNFGSLTKVEIVWDVAGAPAAVTTDNNPTAGKVYAHRYPAFQSPLVKTFQVTLLAYSGGTCVSSKTQSFTLAASPVVTFGTLSGVCLNDTAFQITTARETAGLSGSGLFSGAGVSLNGLFNPATVAAGTHLIKYVYTTNEGCRDSAIAAIKVSPVPTLNGGPDLFVLEGGRAQLNATANGIGLSYRWTPATFLDADNILRPYTSPTTDIVYRLTARSVDGCSATDQVNITVLKAPTIPNAFSPNGDGINDTWNIQYLDTYQGATVQVFNRYGQLVFSSIGYTVPWNGSVKGTVLPVGVYYYIIDPKNGRKQITGSVTLLR